MADRGGKASPVFASRPEVRYPRAHRTGCRQSSRTKLAHVVRDSQRNHLRSSMLPGGRDSTPGATTPAAVSGRRSTLSPTADHRQQIYVHSVPETGSEGRAGANRRVAPPTQDVGDNRDGSQDWRRKTIAVCSRTVRPPNRQLQTGRPGSEKPRLPDGPARLADPAQGAGPVRGTAHVRRDAPNREARHRDCRQHPEALELDPCRHCSGSIEARR